MSSTTIAAYPSVEVFQKEGLLLTICDTSPAEDDCGICLKPLYRATCDGDAATHHHQACSPEQKGVEPAHARPRGSADIPEPGMKVIPCGHEFGWSCLLEWFRSHNTCPMCRMELWPKRPTSAAQPLGRWMEGFF
ncbi:hypothetical protein BKA63DRAFT_148636 [Paraphoma chrysanthemicola]|nr:hypothetical protein BKA63DRAFT_148636 [Paraphoma chrysanthemicola]